MPDPSSNPPNPEESHVAVCVTCEGCGNRVQQNVTVAAVDDAAATLSFDCPHCQRTISFAPKSQ